MCIMPPTLEFFACEIGFGISAFLLGALAAYAELITRYTGSSIIFAYPQALVYIAINGIAAVVAYAIISSDAVELGPFTGSPIGEVLVSGVAAMVVLRSSVASIKRTDNKEVEAGLAPIFQAYLNAADRSFDRRRGTIDLAAVEKMMEGISYECAANSLAPLCISLMQNLRPEEEERLGKDVSIIQSTETVADPLKLIMLGAKISEYTGLELLEKAVQSLKRSQDEGGGAALLDSPLEKSLQRVRAMKIRIFKDTEDSQR